ncbi:hypothetical protein AYR66_10575 [Noviherbaspirillum denitrificans]|uniref:Phosphatidic acid phosphatase type 2/haloperoxidase domain-containing protein n=2 Tax=Noviherbaspirillum denitrificans TaxID=1968433 RepID=A0A254TEX6_9BURK|nr:hypothetical protein AYR66_10575 [Noviherbaspirillum denitrificans]
MICTGTAWAGGGPFGIDSRLNYDNSGIWKRSNQKALVGVMIGGEIAGALWEGTDSRLGTTFWQSVDSSIMGGAGYAVLNLTTRRLRPSQTDDPNQWFQHNGRSFPSGEVTAVSSIVMPFVLEYREDHPAVWALELLPLYDAVARMKTRGHWQSDVVAEWAIGTATGYYAHSFRLPFTAAILPHGLTVGWHKEF